MPFPGLSSSGDQVLVSTVTSRWTVLLIASHIPAARFSGCTMGMPSQVCCVSLLGSQSLAVTHTVDVNCPESQELLVSNRACLQLGRGFLSEAVIEPFWLWLPPACLSLTGNGLVHSLLALFWCLLSPLFCEWAWQCISLGLFERWFSLSLFLFLSLSLSLSLWLPTV